jgi:TolB-like protein/Flp pilus assembly protein TadD
MITGKLPFMGEYEQAVSYAIVNEIPEPLTSLRTGIPMELERIVNRALAKDPKDRYQHADDLFSELNRFKKESDSEKKSIKTTPKKKKKNIVVMPAIFLSIVVLIITGYLVLKSSLPKKGRSPASEWENSIAVLPFGDLSPEKDQEYFCDGMTEQIITNLSKINRLKVIARTSVMTYKNTNKQIQEIGNELNVANILEGSIRKYGNSIRVTAQLINIKDGSHLWADDFDKELEHVFEVQDDVSQAIASNLLTLLSPVEKEEIKTNRPSNTEAYEHYMRGRHFHIQYVMATNQDNFNKTEMLLRRAIELDPNYMPSYAELADLYNTRWNTITQDEDEKNKYLDLQEKYIKIALDLAPNSAEVYATMVYIEEAKGEIEKAYQSLKKAILIQPNLYNLHHAIAYFYTRRGLENLAFRFRSKQIELNPLDTPAYSQRFWLFIKLGEYEKAEIAMQKLLEFDPGRPWAHTQYAYVLIVLKKYEEAEKIISRQEQLFPESAENLASRAFLLAAKGDKDKALEIDIGSDFYKHRLYQLLKMKDEIINYLNRDFEHLREIKRSWYLELMNSPAYEFLHSDPRFQEILAKHKEIYYENLRKYGDID